MPYCGVWPIKCLQGFSSEPTKCQLLRKPTIGFVRSRSLTTFNRPDTTATVLYPLRFASVCIGLLQKRILIIALLHQESFDTFFNSSMVEAPLHLSFQGNPVV
jgi:hypothetical protein